MDQLQWQTVDSVPRCQQVQGHNKYVVAVAWSSDGALLATAAHDKLVNVYQFK
jgi:WD40 repeat protein